MTMTANKSDLASQNTLYFAVLFIQKLEFIFTQFLWWTWTVRIWVRNTYFSLQWHSAVLMLLHVVGSTSQAVIPNICS